MTVIWPGTDVSTVPVIPPGRPPIARVSPGLALVSTSVAEVRLVELVTSTVVGITATAGPFSVKVVE